jgi:ATP:corrinoid adenosyltransferase
MGLAARGMEHHKSRSGRLMTEEERFNVFGECLARLMRKRGVWTTEVGERLNARGKLIARNGRHVVDNAMKDKPKEISLLLFDELCIVLSLDRLEQAELWKAAREASEREMPDE